MLKTAEQLVKAGNVDRERVRDTTKRLDTLWQGLTSRLNTHKEALSYSVTFHQKLEQVRHGEIRQGGPLSGPLGWLMSLTIEF